MRGLVPYEDSPVDEIRSATRSAFRSVVKDAIKNDVHLVVIAGDLYDGSWKDYNTGLFVVSQLGELHDAGIPVAIVLGNHDAESVVTRQLRLPPNTTQLSSGVPETAIIGDTGMAVHGQSYAERAVLEDLSLGYPLADPGLVNIGLLHTCLDGRPGHEPYAPCTIEGLRSKGYDYWALGHVHGFAIVNNDPLAIFSGNLQGRHVRETGAKGACLVTFQDKQPTVERLIYQFVRWEVCTVDVSTLRTLDECLDRCREELIKVVDSGADIYAIRVIFVGSCVANRSLRSQNPHLTAEVRALASVLGGPEIWIEKVGVETSQPRSNLEFTGEGVAGEIGRVLDDLRANVGTILDPKAPLVPELVNLRSQLRATGGDLVDALSAEEISEALGDAAELLTSLMGIEELDDED